MASNLLRFTLVQQFWGQDVLNVFYYQASSPPNILNAQLWLTEFAGKIPGPIREITSTAYVQEKMVLDYPNTGFQAEQSLLNITGSLAGDAAAPFLAFGFKFVRSSNSTRHGAKRIGGLQEAYPTSDLITGEGSNAELDALALAMSEDLEILGGTETAFPVIIGKEGSPDPAIWVANPVASVEFTKITTQNTRKIGAGS